MKKNNFKIVKLDKSKSLFNYEKKVIISELILNLKLGYYDFEKENPFFHVKIEKIVDPISQHDEVETNALMRNIKEQLEKLISLGKVLSSDILMVLEESLKTQIARLP